MYFIKCQFFHVFLLVAMTNEEVGKMWNLTGLIIYGCTTNELAMSSGQANNKLYIYHDFEKMYIS